MCAIAGCRLPALNRRCELLGVIPDDDSPVNYGNRSGHVAEFLKLVERAGVGDNVAFLKRDSVLRKKLFRLLAEHSAGLRENRNLLSHCDLLL